MHFQMHFHEWEFRIAIQNQLKFVPKVPINNKSALVQIMTWHRKGDKPFRTNYGLAY